MSLSRPANPDQLPALKVDYFIALIAAVQFAVPSVTSNSDFKVTPCAAKTVSPVSVVVIGEFWTTLHPVTPAGHPGPVSSPRPNPN